MGHNSILVIDLNIPLRDIICCVFSITLAQALALN